MKLLNVAQTVKAWAAGLGAAAAALSADLVSGAPLGVGEWLTVALAGLTALGVVYRVPNAKDAPAVAPVPSQLP
jgi:hypothetical protein